MKTAALLLLLILTGGTISAQNKALSGLPASRSFIGEKIEKMIYEQIHLNFNEYSYF